MLAALSPSVAVRDAKKNERPAENAENPPNKSDRRRRVLTLHKKTCRVRLCRTPGRCTVGRLRERCKIGWLPERISCIPRARTGGCRSVSCNTVVWRRLGLCILRCGIPDEIKIDDDGRKHTFVKCKPKASNRRKEKAFQSRVPPFHPWQACLGPLIPR